MKYDIDLSYLLTTHRSLHLCKLNYVLIAVVMASLTELENHMMCDGRFVFSTLSPERKEMLFKDFQTAYSREVTHDTFSIVLRQVNDVFMSLLSEHVVTIDDFYR